MALEQLNRLTVEEFARFKKLNCVVVADNIRSGQNIGSLFRTADAFAFNKVYLTGISPEPPNKEILKTALGATETVIWSRIVSEIALVEELKRNQTQIIVVEQTAKSIMLDKFIPNSQTNYALVFGNEVDGVSHEFIKNADLCIEIPQVGTKHSLNVSVCAGIVMWHMFNFLR